MHIDFDNFSMKKILKFLSTAKAEGATIVYGGVRPQVNHMLLLVQTSCT